MRIDSAKQEQVQTESNKQKSKKMPVLLIVILILFLLTTAVLGSRLYNMATRDQYTVDLDVGDADASIELFRIEYSNAEGEITVEGVRGENVVAPGTSVGYDVRLRNNDDIVINFMMTPTVEFLTENRVPVEFKVMDDYGNYILGDEKTWVSAEEMNKLSHKGSVHPGEVFTYHVNWRWVFEVSDEQDTYDTYLGDIDAAVLPGVRVGIETDAVASPNPVKAASHTMHLLGNGFGCCWCCWMVWVLLLVLLALCAWIWYLIKRHDEREDIMAEYEAVLQAHGLMVGGELIGHEQTTT